MDFEYFCGLFARVVEYVYTQDLKSCGQQCPYGFDSRLEHKKAGLHRLFCARDGNQTASLSLSDPLQTSPQGEA